MRRGGSYPDLSLRGADHGLAQGGLRSFGVRAGRGPGLSERVGDLRLLQEVWARHDRDGGQLPQQGANLAAGRV